MTNEIYIVTKVYPDGTFIQKSFRNEDNAHRQVRDFKQIDTMEEDCWNEYNTDSGIEWVDYDSGEAIAYSTLTLED